MQSRRGRPRCRAKAAVVVDPRRDQRVGELQEDGARPPEEDEAFGVQALRDYCRSFSARLAPPALSASAEADFHNQPAMPTSARPIAP